jgi:predicted nucleic acid-binding protein
MAVVVSNTSPLRALDHLGHIDWLEQLFDQVYLPPAVAAELREPPAAFRPLDVKAKSARLSLLMEPPVFIC